MTSLTERFKAGFRRHPAGVALVVCATPDGPVGLTASSVTSVSATPPMLSFSVSRARSSAAALTSSAELAVHVLSAQQAHVAAAFAAAPEHRFAAHQGWRPAPDGPPTLPGTPATYRVRPSHVLPAGEAWLVVCEVVDVELGPEAEPLVYYDGGYWSLDAQVVPVAGRAREGA